MTAHGNQHLDSTQRELYVIGAHDEIDAAGVEAHLRACEDCLDQVRREARVDLALVEAAAQARFCPGCGAVMAAPVCPHCGAIAEAGGFTVERVIVQNAHGRMYLARDAQGTAVALKELAFVQAPHPDAVAAFEREGRLLRQLDHPAIPRFLASFRAGDGVNTRLYLAQEFVEGESLQAHLERHQFSEGEAREVAAQVLAILEYLQGLAPMVFHRDVKPANLIRRPDGRIALVDFGAARDMGSTVGATLVGTFGYMPVEQLGGIVDATTDLHALGATLCHLVSRREPWRFLEDPTSFDRLNVSPAFRAFLARLTARRPVDRFPNAAAAAQALRSPAPLAPPARRLSRHRAALVAVVLAAAGFAVSVGATISMSRLRSTGSQVSSRPSAKYTVKTTSQKVRYRFERGTLAIDLQSPAHRFPMPAPDDPRAGAVWVDACVSEGGEVVRADIAHSTHPALNAGIRERILTWRFVPEREQGRPVPFCTRVRYEIDEQR